MSQFICRLGAGDGRVFEQVHQANDESTLRQDLERQGLHIFSLERQGLGASLSLPKLFRRRHKLPMVQFLVFNQELAALLKAGLPLLQAFEMMVERTPLVGTSEEQRAIIEEMG